MENDNNVELSNNPQPINSIMKSIFLSELKPIGIDIMETGVDSLLESEALKNIPIVKTVHSLAKASLAIRDKYLLKKILIFIETLNQGNAKLEEMEKRRKAAEKNEKWINKEVELITIHLDRLDELRKTQITAMFYIQYINEEITWTQYQEYLAIIERVFFQDFIQLLSFYNALLQEKEIKKDITDGLSVGDAVMTVINKLNCDRLIAVGLVQAKQTPRYDEEISTEYYLTELGLKFAEVLIKIEKSI